MVSAKDEVELLHLAITRMREKIPGISEAAAEALEHELILEFGGESHYVPKRKLIEAKRKELANEARRKFNGRNATEVARELGIGRATVYRLIKISL
jgi:Mor family transcriptional regulator